MSWQSASFIVLGLVLLAGFAWYERSRPPARTLALVAALAALAVVGRLAFAPIPNVQATTDIVLITGFALGGAPGFCVGAVTALVSNIFFLQGPWTPWQMAAWGGVGVAGAALARAARGRELGRLPLATACGAAGLAFGAVMDLQVWTLGAEQTLASYLAVSAASLPFNLAHAAANVGFCLLIGPLLVRSLRRYRRRGEFEWDPAGGDRLRPSPAPLATLAAVVIAGGSLAAAPAVEASTGDAVRYLERAQNRDGGFGGDPRSSSNQLHTGWAALGLAAAGTNPRDVAKGGRSVVDYVRRGVGSDTGSLSRTILVLTASGVSPRSFGRRDLVAELRAKRRRNGSYDGLVNQTAFAVVALEAAGSGSPRSAGWLQARQNASGGFGFNSEDGSPEDTGYVLQALAAAGKRRSDTARRAVAYMEKRQRPSGGFAGAVTPVNAQATAFAVQGLIAAGRSGRHVRRAIRYLRSLQAGDGSIRYASGDGRTPVWVTGQALLALEREPFPIGAVPRHLDREASGGSGSAAGGAGPAAPGSQSGGAGPNDPAGEAAGGGGDAGTGGGRPGAEAKVRRSRSGDPPARPPMSILPGGESGPVAELAKGGGAAAPGDGSVLGGVIAAASSAALVVGIRRRIGKRIPASASAEAPKPSQ